MKSNTRLHDMTNLFIPLNTQTYSDLSVPVIPVNATMLGEAVILFEVERFVEQVRTNPMLPIDELRPLLIHHLKLFSQVYDPHLEYSIRLKLFVHVMLEAETIVSYQSHEALWSASSQDIQYLQSLFYLHQINQLIDNERWQRQQDCQSNLNHLNQYIDALLIHYARLLVVRVDLKYRHDAQPYVTMSHFKQHMDQFRQIIGKGRQCFDSLHGSVWSIEQGDEDGNYHSHILLMFDANDYQNDYCKGMEVGQLWETITAGQGTYFNCSDPQYKQWLTKAGCCGLGVIRREDQQGQDNVRKAAQYLVKDSQHLRVKLPNMKTFDHGQFRLAKRRGIDETLNQVRQSYKPNFGL